jgi:hypothetical protein
VFNEKVRVQREFAMDAKEEKDKDENTSTKPISPPPTPTVISKSDESKLSTPVPPVNPAMQMYTQQLMTYLHSLGNATPDTNNPAMNPSFYFPFTPQAPNLGMPLPPVPLNQKKGAEPSSPTTGQLLGPHRFWKIEFPDEAIKKDIRGEEVVVNITMKIRGEEASQYVPERLYSSHKYVLQHTVEGEMLVAKYPLIVSKLQIVDPVSREKIVNSMKGKKDDVVKGTPEAALTPEGSTGEDTVTGVMKIQFTDVSYRHEKGHFSMLISYYNPANLEEPLFNLISPAFKVFARKPTDKNPTETLKPNKQKPSLRKRKQDTPEVPAMMPMFGMQLPQTMQQPVQTVSQQEEEPEPKKMKFSQVFTEFNKKLEQLANMRERLNDNDKQAANDFSLEKLLSIDPDFTLDFFLKNDLQNNMNISQNVLANLIHNNPELANTLQGLTQQRQQAEQQQQPEVHSSEFLNSEKFKDV